MPTDCRQRDKRHKRLGRSLSQVACQSGSQKQTARETAGFAGYLTPKVHRNANRLMNFFHRR